MNYIAITGPACHRHGGQARAAAQSGRRFRRQPLYLAFGILAGVIRPRDGRQGQVVDCAMSDGAASLMSMFWHGRGRRLEGGQPEPAGWRGALLRHLPVLGRKVDFHRLHRAAVLCPCCWKRPASMIRNSSARWTVQIWPELRRSLAAVIATKTQDEWCEIMDGTDVCFPRS